MRVRVKLHGLKVVFGGGVESLLFGEGGGVKVAEVAVGLVGPVESDLFLLIHLNNMDGIIKRVIRGGTLQLGWV